MLTMLPSGYNINTAGLSQHHRVRGRVGGDALAGVGFPPQLTTEPMTGPTVPAAGGGATRVRTLMARPAGPRPHTPHYNVISNRSGRRPRHPSLLAGHFDRVVISGAQSLQRPRSRPNQEKSGSGVGAELLDPGGRSKIEPWPVLGIRANDSIRGRGCGRLSLGSRPAQGNPAQYEKISKTFRRLPLTQRRLKAIGCSWRCTASFLPWIHCLPNVCVLCTLLHSVLPSKGELQPRHVSRGALNY